MAYDPSTEPRASAFMNWPFPYLMRWGQKIMYEKQRMIVRVTPWTLIKGPLQEQELEAMLFVASHTTVPLPKTHRTYRRENGLFIEMDFVQGTRLETLWDAGGISESIKQEIVKSLENFVEQLRALSLPKGFAVGSTSGGPFNDGCIAQRLIQPFKTISKFHQYLRGGTSLEQCAEDNSDVFACHQQEYRTCFSHADLCPRNIILKPDGTPAIIDWEFAGWWPEYWETTKCHFTVFKEHVGWLDLIEENLTKYPLELKAERALWKGGR